MSTKSKHTFNVCVKFLKQQTNIFIALTWFDFGNVYDVN